RGVVVLAHGWGGTRDHLNQAYAPFLAAEGFVALTIDYRGWGDSDSRLVAQEGMPKTPDATGTVSLEAIAVREEVDPLDQTEDIRNAITWVQGQPGVDPERIGLWGSSYSGGHVIWVAAHDPRVKVTVSQVGSMDSKGIIETLDGGWQALQALERARARGDAAPYAEIPAREGLRGTPDYVSMAQYSPRDVAHRSQAAAMIIDAEKEELFDIKEHGQAVHAILKNRVPTEYHVIPGITHYGIYREAREQALKLAIDWYRQHL
ncbi:MAG: alpha/beta fold hydrolase, partial [Acidobacteriota bacterium]